MSLKIFLAGDSVLFSPYYNYDPKTTTVALRQEGPSIQKAFRDHEMAVRGRTPKVNSVMEEVTVVESVSTVEAVPAEQPIAVPAVPTAPLTTPPPSTTAEVPKRKLVLKLKDTAPVQRPKPKLVLKNQPSQ